MYLHTCRSLYLATEEQSNFVCQNPFVVRYDNGLRYVKGR